METTLMLKTALALLTIAALGGATMAGIRFASNANPPAWLAMLHGLLAGAALTLLLYAYFTVGLSIYACWALVLFLVAAAGGAFLNLAYHQKLQPIPKAIVLLHAAFAVAGYVLMLMAVFAPK